MGVYPGQMWLSLAFPHEPDKGKFEEYWRCHQNAIKELSWQMVNPGTARRAAGLHWVVNLIPSKVPTAKCSEKQRALEQLYYARMCRAMCGAEVGRLLCDYFVHLPEFAKAINCRVTPEMSF